MGNSIEDRPLSEADLAQVYDALRARNRPPNAAWCSIQAHLDFETKGSLGVLLPRTGIRPSALAAFRREIRALDVYCRSTGNELPDGDEGCLDSLLRRTVSEETLASVDIQAFIKRVSADTLPPGFAGVWLQSVCQHGLSWEDTMTLTEAMRDSGHCYDLRKEPRLQNRRIIRRYPTGGLSEKVALILPALLVAVRDQVPPSVNLPGSPDLGVYRRHLGSARADPGISFSYIELMNPTAASSIYRAEAIQAQARLVVQFFDAMMRQEVGNGEWSALAWQLLADGRALSGFRALLKAHGVDENTSAEISVEPLSVVKVAPIGRVAAEQTGHLIAIDQRQLGTLANSIA